MYYFETSIRKEGMMKLGNILKVNRCSNLFYKLIISGFLTPFIMGRQGVDDKNG